MRMSIHQFLHSQTVAGLALIFTAALALILANSPLAPSYNAFLNISLFHHNTVHWVNDALMAAFFFLVGLEIKHELLHGNLKTWPQRILPGMAALGGMVVPALIFMLINRNSPATLHGWAIPTATDIAFALGILSLIPRVPVSLKIFLTALAILDDLGAIILIAIFYSDGFALTPFVLSAILIAALFTFNKCRVLNPLPYIVTGLLLWTCVYQSALHATLAGVILALAIPSKTAPKLQHHIHPWVAFLVLPLFAFCNAGISFEGITLSSFTNPLTLGIFMGLLVGKQIGVGAAMWASIKFLKAPKPQGTTLPQLYAVTLLCGIGFTMSLFIGNLSVTDALQPQVRLGILAASCLAAITAAAILTLTHRPK